MYARAFHVKHPQGPINMQFSAAHSIANAALRVTPGPMWQYPETVSDPKMKKLRDIVNIELAPRTIEVMAKDLAGGFPNSLGGYLLLWR